MRILKACAAALSALILVLGSAVPSSAATVATYDLWAWNVAGWTMHRASTTDGLIPALADSIRNRGAKFSGLNELCYQQYQAIIANLRASGWPQDSSNFARFEPSHDTVCNGQAFGNAIFSKAPLGSANRYQLPSVGTTERRTLLCAPLSALPHLRFCTTHITPSNAIINGTAINVQQLDSVRTRLETFAANGDTVLIAGDFNAQPNYSRLNNWYAPSLDVANNSDNTGYYRELDDLDGRCLGYGETTVADGNTEGPCGLGKKIDLIFVRESRLAGGYTGDSLAISTTCTIGACSDHRVVIGTVTVSVN